MRRIVLLLVVTGTLSGCVLSDRFAYARQDPVIWFLSGMPAPYDLSYQRSPIPDLPVLNPLDYVPVPPPQPLDYPRGWSPDNPPLMPIDGDFVSPSAQPAPEAPPESRCATVDCNPAAPLPYADGAVGGVRADARVDSDAAVRTVAVTIPTD